MIHANDNGRPITFISMFSGIEAASVAFGPLGWRAICFAEIEKFPSAVLAHHYPDVPNVGDMSKHDWSQYAGKVDIVCGGPPCQDFSIAGLRAGLDGERGNLSIVYMRALHAIKPRNAIVENVPGWLNDKKNAFGCFLAGLVGADDPLRTPDGKSWPNAGMVAGPLGRAAWRVLDAQYFGLAQRRRRVIVVADFGNGADPAAVLFEQDGLRRHSPPSREAGKDVAPTISARTKGGGGLGTDFDLDGGLIRAFGIQGNMIGRHDSAAPAGSGFSDDVSFTLTKTDIHGVAYAPEIARCVATREGSSQDYETTTMVAVGVHGDVAHTLKAEGADASEDGTGRGTPIVAFAREVAGSLTANYGKQPDSSNTAIGPNLIAQTVAIRGREGGATAELGGEVATALRASQGGGDKPHVLAFDTYNQDAAEVTHTLRRGSGDGVAMPAVLQSAVRLTPRECERLQGFQWLCDPTYPGAWQDEAGRWWSPDYTAIPWRGKPADQCPDGPRYRALGNSWAVPKFVWLGKRLQRLLADNTNTPAKEAA